MKKIFFIQVILIVFFYPFKSYSYSSDPKQFISEIVIETKKYSTKMIARDLNQKN